MSSLDDTKLKNDGLVSYKFMSDLDKLFTINLLCFFSSIFVRPPIILDMKNILSIISILISFTFCSCSKDGDGVAPESYFCAELNGEKWSGEVNASIIDNHLKIRIINYADKKKLIQQGTLGINAIPLNINKYGLTFLGKDSIVNTIASSAYATRQDGGDVISDYYYLSTKDSLNNYIQIIEYNEKRNLIKGSFSGIYIRDSMNILNPLQPNQMTFKKGTFCIKLK